jgi:hypothetical protein
MPSDINRLTVPTLAKGLHVVVRPCNLRRSLLFKEIAILDVPRSPCLQNTLSMAVQASSMAPAVTGRRVDTAVPGSRRVAIISGPTGGRRCHRCGALLKRTKAPRSLIAVSRFGSSSGTPGPGVARELQFKSQKPFQRRGEVFFSPGGTPARHSAMRVVTVSTAGASFLVPPYFPLLPGRAVLGLRMIRSLPAPVLSAVSMAPDMSTSPLWRPIVV